jgi:hypothetical protein
MPFVFLVILCSKSFGLEFGLEHRCLIQIGLGVFGVFRGLDSSLRVRSQDSFDPKSQRCKRDSARFPDSGLGFGGAILPSAEGNQGENQFQAE